MSYTSNDSKIILPWSEFNFRNKVLVHAMLLCLSVCSNAAGVTEYGGSKTVVMKVESIIYICNKGTFF